MTKSNIGNYMREVELHGRYREVRMFADGEYQITAYKINSVVPVIRIDIKPLHPQPKIYKPEVQDGDAKVLGQLVLPEVHEPEGSEKACKGVEE